MNDFKFGCSQCDGPLRLAYKKIKKSHTVFLCDLTAECISDQTHWMVLGMDFVVPIDSFHGAKILESNLDTPNPL